MFLFFPAAMQNMNRPIFCSVFKEESFKLVQGISYHLQGAELVLQKSNAFAATVDIIQGRVQRALSKLKKSQIYTLGTGLCCALLP